MSRPYRALYDFFAHLRGVAPSWYVLPFQGREGDARSSGVGFKMVRYADDMVVMCCTIEEAQAALAMIWEWMEGNGLSLNEEKSQVVDMSQYNSYFDFLGYRFKRTKRGLNKYVRPKSKQKLRQNFKPRTKRCNGKSLEEICQIINPTLRGWHGYFKHAHHTELQAVDSWVRGRLRSILRKRRGGRGRGRAQITTVGATTISLN
ncbi:MAG: hypothetical protein GX230_06515 [Lentisphaerae bacterium]|nr:hypothetical protein [Lentisphaerota bacterium]